MHIVFFLQNTSCIRKPPGHCRGVGEAHPCTLPLDPPLTVYFFALGISSDGDDRMGANRPVPIVLVKCWKVAHALECQKVAKKLPKIQKVATKISKVAA